MNININVRNCNEDERINKLLERIMSALTDLQAKFDQAVTDVTKALNDAAAKLDELAAVIAGEPSATELAAVSADLTAQSDNLEAAAAAMEAKLAPPPTPTP